MPVSGTPDSASRQLLADTLREAVRQAAADSSLRAVARDVGMTAMGLKAFIEGTSPRADTLRKLRAWYVRESAEAGAVNAQAAEAAFAVVVANLPMERREAAREKLRDVLREEYRASSGSVPDWLR